MSVEKIDWVEQITQGMHNQLEPIEGQWGKFYAGSEIDNLNCIVVPHSSQISEMTIGFFKITNESELLDIDCIKIEWKVEQQDSALLFIDDLLRTEEFLNAPVKVLMRKRSVWKKINEQKLDKYRMELTGLWGEMAFLKRNPKLDSSWTGPAGTDRDFNSPKYDIEVKTTFTKSKKEIRISSIDQLSSDKDLFFILLHGIGLAPEDGESLKDLYNIIKNYDINPEVIFAVEKQMILFGDSLCSDTKFRSRFAQAYKVDQGFPVLNKKILENILGRRKMSRITDLKYSVNLSGYNHMEEQEFIQYLDI